MSGIAWLFPGQGSQAPGMGRDVAEQHPAARRIFEEADAALEFPLSRLCFEGPDEELRRTAVTQPAILTVSVALLRVLQERGLRPDFVAGHSLGEYSALVAAGSLSFTDAVRTVHLRGRWMQEAVPEGQGAMAALLGLEEEKVAEICADAAEGEVLSPANFNSPGQVVVAGHAGAVDRAVKLAGERGAMRAIRLPVSAPFHCALMGPAQERLATHLATVPFADLEVPLVTNVDAEPIRVGDAAREALARQVTAPVRWDASMRRLGELGAARAYEVGPGKVLSGLMRRIDRKLVCKPVSDAAGIEAVLAAAAEEA